jgi:LPS export ABC transporter protein LptC
VLLRRLLPLSLLAAVAVTLFVLLRPENVLPITARSAAAEDDVQTYLINSLAQRFNDEGALVEVLVSPRVDYYAAAGVSILQQPKLWRLGATHDETWQAWGDVGEYQHLSELLVLRGNTVLHRLGDGSELHSAEIWLDARRDQAYTDTPVSIVEKSRRTTAKSFNMNLRSGEAQLRDQVESVYEPK